MAYEIDNSKHKDFVYNVSKTFNGVYFKDHDKIYCIFSITTYSNILTARLCMLKHHKRNTYLLETTPSYLGDVDLYCKHCDKTHIKVVDSKRFYCVNCDEVYLLEFNTDIFVSNVKLDTSPHY